MFRSVEELTAAIEEHLARDNETPQAFTWTAGAGAILEEVRRARAVLDKVRRA